MLSAIAKLFPSSMFSAGGDEVNANCYAQDPVMQQYLNSIGQNLDDALNAFVQKTQAVLIKEGKTPLISEGGASITLLTQSSFNFLSRNDSI